MDLNLLDKVAIVTGASRGIGKAIAAGLAAEGCKLVICARESGALEKTAEEFRKGGAFVETVSIDITDPDAPNTLVTRALESFGAVHVFVGNAGTNRRKPFEETTDEDWSDVMDLNLNAHVRCSRAVIPHLRQAGGGAILFVTSIFGREAGGPGLSIYNATKSALISVVKIMAQELGKDGIRVNSLAPGSIRFPGGSWDRRCVEDPEGMARFIEENIPMGRFGTAEEVAAVATFMCSPRASWLSGACVNVDGVQSKSLI